jgi:hypothetical protein
MIIVVQKVLAANSHDNCRRIRTFYCTDLTKSVVGNAMDFKTP